MLNTVSMARVLESARVAEDVERARALTTAIEDALLAVPSNELRVAHRAALDNLLELTERLATIYPCK